MVRLQAAFPEIGSCDVENNEGKSRFYPPAKPFGMHEIVAFPLKLSLITTITDI
jgi:hypothetical protein